MMRWLLTLSLIALLFLGLALTAHATVITWDFNRTGALGTTTTELGSDGLSILSLAGFLGTTPAVLFGRQQNPIDHGYGIQGPIMSRPPEIDQGEYLRLTFPANIPIGPIEAYVESVDGPPGTGEGWAIVDSAGTTLASGFGGGIAHTTVILPSDRIIRFTVPAGPSAVPGRPDDYLVERVSVNIPNTPSQVDAPGSGVFIGLGVTLMTGVLLLRGRGRRPAAR